MARRCISTKLFCIKSTVVLPSSELGHSHHEGRHDSRAIVLRKVESDHLKLSWEDSVHTGAVASEQGTFSAIPKSLPY